MKNMNYRSSFGVIAQELLDIPYFNNCITKIDDFEFY